MRSLLIELRPARLAEADIRALLQQLINAAGGRSKVAFALNTSHEPCPMPDDVKIIIYRVAQEALNNVIKHAAAAQAFVSLRCTPQQMVLQVLDDGRGFEPERVPGGHFGLGIMRERAASIGATLIIDTEPGEGTEIELRWRRDE